MATVIDELVVVLGLDPRKFTEGQRDAIAAFKRTQQEALEFGKRVQESSEKSAEALGAVRKGVIGIIAGIAGGGVVAFIERITQMDAATGRMAKTIGTSVPNLSTWQYMIKQIGGDAASATSTLSALQQEIESVRQGGGMFQGGYAQLMNQAGVSIRDDADTALRKIQGYISGQISGGKMRPEEAATFLRRVPGMNQDVLNLLLDDFQKIEQAARKSAVASQKSADEAIKTQAISASRIQALERWGLALIDLLGKKPGEVTRDDFRKLNPFAAPPAAQPSKAPSAPRAAVQPSAKSYGDDEAVSQGLYDPPGSAAAEKLKRETDWLRGRGPSDIGAKGGALDRSINNSRSSSSRTEININKIEVNAPNAKDADGVASEIGSAMRRQSLIAPANYGLA
jgi:hypothetical protein